MARCTIAMNNLKPGDRGRPNFNSSSSAPRAAASPTSLRMVAGLEEISSGEIVITGRWSTTSLPRGVATSPWCSSPYALYPHMTVEAEHGLSAAYGETARGGKEPARQPAAEILDILPTLLGPLSASSSRALASAQRVAMGPAPTRPLASGLPNGRAAVGTSTPSSACRCVGEIGPPAAAS